MPNDVVNLKSALDSIAEPWQPHRLASVNDSDVKVAKLLGEFVWHAHPESDELFLVVAGRPTLQLRDGDVSLGLGDVYVVPRGVEHCPLAVDDASVVMIELQGTVNTGNAGGERTTRVRELGDGESK
ncbi:MAG TPA: cupin domain-containing protein [Galbitalea sp.]|jgi:mannose-6-phosphate isomerase-like protein (cupin superfamily)